jgi:hypothetical protein
MAFGSSIWPIHQDCDEYLKIFDQLEQKSIDSLQLDLDH